MNFILSFYIRNHKSPEMFLNTLYTHFIKCSLIFVCGGAVLLYYTYIMMRETRRHVSCQLFISCVSRHGHSAAAAMSPSSVSREAFLLSRKRKSRILGTEGTSSLVIGDLGVDVTEDEDDITLLRPQPARLYYTADQQTILILPEFSADYSHLTFLLRI